MPAQPEGSVTILFSDIEGSTALLQEVGAERYGRVLERHRHLLRTAFGRHDGFEVSVEGDSCYFTFAEAEAAAAAAQAAQRALADEAWADGGPVRVRIGLHTGTPMVVPGAYVGVDVHKAARIMAAGHGGQILVSASTRALLGPAANVDDLGEHRLKDLLGPERLFQLPVAGPKSEFPPLKTLGTLATNLPVQPTPFVGRRSELDELAALLQRDSGVRLLSLVGPGATGKTRLALQAAADALEQFEEVTFVALAHLREPSLVLPAIVDALDVHGGRNDDPVETLAAWIAARRLLLGDRQRRAGARSQAHSSASCCSGARVSCSWPRVANAYGWPRNASSLCRRSTSLIPTTG